VTLRRMGFAPATAEVRIRAGRTDSLVFSLTALATTIAGVLVEDEAEARSRRILAGFWERRERGFGHFLTRDDIEKRDAHDFADLTRMVPSVNIALRNGRKTIRFRSTGARDCPPQYVVDGMRIENGSADEFIPQDIEALELYSGPATIPPQFAPRFNSYTCGAIVIWTRLPGT
jgi:outer membrane receptor for ferrienterochelin and colicin